MKNQIVKKFTVAHFKKWLRTLAPDVRFEYGNCGHCAIASYLKDQGAPYPLVGAFEFSVYPDKSFFSAIVKEAPIPDAIVNAFKNLNNSHTPFTAGEILRALKGAR